MDWPEGEVRELALDEFDQRFARYRLAASFWPTIAGGRLSVGRSTPSTSPTKAGGGGIYSVTCWVIRGDNIYVLPTART